MNTNTQMELISSRIREMREILDITPEEIAEKLGVTTAEYEKYETAQADIPISILYGISAVLGIDPTVILTGDAPRMDNYTVVRNGGGVTVERYKGYSFSSLAFNFIGRDMDPMIVDLKREGASQTLVTHNGQEFNFVLEGTVLLVLGQKQIVLEKGDCAYFDPAVPHGQFAITPEAKFLTVINEKSAVMKKEEER